MKVDSFVTLKMTEQFCHNIDLVLNESEIEQLRVGQDVECVVGRTEKGKDKVCVIE